jgi:hypothetical protein
MNFLFEEDGVRISYVLATAAAAVVVGITACSPKGESSLPLKFNNDKVLGAWLAKDEATELRSTGKLESLCPELKKEPDVMIMNARLIDSDGSVYLYNPDLPNGGRYPQAKMGVIGNDGVMTLSPNFKSQAGFGNVTITQVDATTLHFDFGGNLGMDYVRSNESEVRAYFNAQKACLP